MPPDAMVATFKSLKLFAMAQAVDALAKQNLPAWHSAESVLDALLKAEVAEREVRSINYQTKAARFPVHRDLVGFDFSESTANEHIGAPLSMHSHRRSRSSPRSRRIDQ